MKREHFPANESLKQTAVQQQYIVNNAISRHSYLPQDFRGV